MCVIPVTGFSHVKMSKAIALTKKPKTGLTKMALC